MKGEERGTEKRKGKERDEEGKGGIRNSTN